ncbi:hypothetical protein Tco_0090867 [Tanacetum coccineum]
MFMKLFRSDDKFSQMLTQLESEPEIGGGSGSGGDDEPGDDEDGDEDGEDEDDRNVSLSSFSVRLIPSDMSPGKPIPATSRPGFPRFVAGENDGWQERSHLLGKGVSVGEKTGWKETDNAFGALDIPFGNDAMESKKDTSDALNGDDDDCYDNIKANGENTSQDKVKEKSMKRDELNGELGSKINNNGDNLSNGEDAGKVSNSFDLHAAKERNKDNTCENSVDSNSMATANANPQFVSTIANTYVHVNSVNMNSYANVVGNNGNELDKNLIFVPTGLNDNGEKAVIFEEELVIEGSKKWQLTMCGYFVRCSLSPAEIRYNLRRM